MTCTGHLAGHRVEISCTLSFARSAHVSRVRMLLGRHGVLYATGLKRVNGHKAKVKMTALRPLTRGRYRATIVLLVGGHRVAVVHRTVRIR